MLVKNLKLFLTILCFGSMLIACGDSDSGAESAAPAASESTASDSMEKSGMEKSGMDNGVVYQDEIYKNWPYQ